MGRKQKKTQPARVVVAVRIDAPDAESLKATSERTGVSVSDLLRPAIRRVARKAA